MIFTIKNPIPLLTHFETLYSIFFQRLPFEINWNKRIILFAFLLIFQRNNTYQTLSFLTYFYGTPFKRARCHCLRTSMPTSVRRLILLRNIF
jgi:hypothetical protein